MTSMRRYLGVLYVLANLLDLSLTIHGVRLTSAGMEVNLVARGILLSHGFAGLSTFKLAGVAFILVLCTVLAHREWSKPWGKHLDLPVLLAGSMVSLIGAWSWICVFQEAYR